LLFQGSVNEGFEEEDSAIAGSDENYSTRFEFCFLNIPSILSDFLSGEKLTNE
jgi:hypothetical protein